MHHKCTTVEIDTIEAIQHEMKERFDDFMKILLQAEPNKMNCISKNDISLIGNQFDRKWYGGGDEKQS